MLRRRLPWFVVAGLFVLWAYGLYNDRFGENAGYIPEDFPQRSLGFLDKNLRLEEIAIDQPPLVRWALFGSDREEIMRQTRAALESFARTDELDATGRRALAVVSDELGAPQINPDQLDAPARKLLIEGGTLSPVESAELAGNLDHRGNWWDEQLALRQLRKEHHPTLARAVLNHQRKDRTLFDGNLVCIGVYSLLSYGGLVFLPYAIRRIRRGWTAASLHRPVRYRSRLDPSLVVALFLSADLIAGYFIQGAYDVSPLIGSGFVFDVTVDSLWRLLAPGLALVVLFRKPRHAIRSLGLDTWPDWRLILATFALVSWVDAGYSLLIQPYMDFDPSGGLDPMEDGWGGLFYGLLSACVLAPIAEEIFYRGILLRGLEWRFRFWVSAAVVTVAFMLGHSYDVFGLVSVGIIGFTMVVVYRATGSLTTVIVLHALYNLTITVPQWIVYHAK